MITILSWLYGIYFFLSSAVMVSIATLICLFTAPFDQNRKLVHQFACLWGYHYMLINPLWRCTIDGRENIDPQGTYVLVANHQSYWDIMLLYGLFRHFKWVSKQSVLKIPFIGWNMKINQYVCVTREDLKSIKAMMASCRKWLENGSSIMIFPEGTRTEDGRIGDFRDGPFKLAIEAGVPVVPIVLSGTYDIFPKHAKKLGFSATVQVKVLPPIDSQAYKGAARELREHVRNVMLKHFPVKFEATPPTALAHPAKKHFQCRQKCPLHR